MFFRPLVLIGAFFVVASGSAFATDALTLDSAIDLALAHNRDLAAARFAIEQAKGRLEQAGLRPNPEVEFSHSNDLLFANEGEYNLSLGYKQRFPITGRLAKAKAVARLDVALATLEVRNQERLLAGEVLELGREWLVAREKIAVNDEIARALRNLIDVSEKRLRAAEVSEVDVNLSRLELQRVELAQSVLSGEQAAVASRLNGLLGRDPETPVSLTDSVNSQFDRSSAAGAAPAALSRRPDRQLIAQQIDRAEADAVLARAEKWEDWTVGVNYGRDYARFAPPVGGKLDNSFGVGVSVPLPLWNKNQGRISEARATKQRAAAELSAIDLRIVTEIKTAEQRMLRLSDSLGRFRTASAKLADDNLALLQKGYAEGLTNITAVIQAQQQARELRQAYLDTLGEFLRAKTEWETASASVLRGPAAN